jgi:3'-phosphoadenosine 5'-phosphosulfate sulfotransferase
VHTRLHADVHGIATLVVSDGEVRRMREQRVQRNLEHVRAYFRRRVSSR